MEDRTGEADARLPQVAPLLQAHGFTVGTALVVTVSEADGRQVIVTCRPRPDDNDEPWLYFAAADAPGQPVAPASFPTDLIVAAKGALAEGPASA